MKVVSNTGPIIALAKAGRLQLLRELFGEVFIPAIVQRELCAKTGDEGELIENALKDFLHVSEYQLPDETTNPVLSDLDKGERAAISLASAMSGEALLLMDDKAGRQAAERLNIFITGTVGILLLAKEKGLIEGIADTLDEIRSRGYWLSGKLIEIAKQLSGEE